MDISELEFIALLVILGMVVLLSSWYLYFDIKPPTLELTNCELTSANGNLTVVSNVFIVNNDAVNREVILTGIINPGNQSQEVSLTLTPFEGKTVSFQYPSSKDFRGTCSWNAKVVLRNNDIRKYLATYSYSGPHGVITNKLACPTSCDDVNVCTRDFCSIDTDYACVNEPITDNLTNCGQSAGCFYSSCYSGKCLSNLKTNCCGNGLCETNESFLTCPDDCNNSVNVKCSIPTVILPSQTRSGLGIANCIIKNLNPENISLILNSQVINWSERYSKEIRLEGNQRNTQVVEYQFNQDFYFNDVVRDATVNFSVLQENYEIYAKSDSVKIGAKGDVDWTEPQVAYAVTPQDPCVEHLLTKVKEKIPSKALFGYLGTEDDVETQARAVYDTLHELNFSYVNSPVTFTPGVVQRVRLPYESIRDKSGNCADGSLLFASIFENLDMEPIIIVVPGHAFVALKTASNSKEVIFIETTMVGTNSYDEAVSTAAKEYTDNLDVAYTYDIKELRDRGYLPRPSFSTSCEVD